MIQTDARIVSIGLDVAKASFEAALATPAQLPAQPLASKPYARLFEGAAQLVQAVEAHPSMIELAQPLPRIVMEATGAYSRQLAEWLVALRPQWRVAVVNPRFIKAYAHSLGARNKTDRADARLIARYGLERQPVWFEPLAPALKALRALSRERDALVAQIVQTKNRAGETPDAPDVVVSAQRAVFQALDKQRRRIEAAMLELLVSDPTWGPLLERLQSIPGVGKITAMVVLAELGDLRRFSRSRQLSAFAGTNPQIIESGSSLRRRTRMCKMGSSRVRQALYLSAMAAIRTKRTNSLALTYKRLVAQGKPKLVALGAIMRKQLLLMRALMLNGTRFGDPVACAKPVESLCRKAAICP